MHLAGFPKSLDGYCANKDEKIKKFNIFYSGDLEVFEEEFWGGIKCLIKNNKKFSNNSFHNNLQEWKIECMRIERNLETKFIISTTTLNSWWPYSISNFLSN